MSDTGVIVDDAVSPDVRRQRKDAPERRMSESSADHVAIESHEDAGPTPEEALQAAQKALADKDKDLAAKDRALAAERNAAASARDEAARQKQGRQSDRSAAVTAAAEAAQSDKVAATIALKSAREAGDLDAELKAMEMLSSANFRINQTASEITEMKMTAEEGPKRTAPDRGASPAISARSQQWIDVHPKFNSDPAYKNAALNAHYQAVKDGAPVDSPAYFRYLDDAVASLDRTDHDTGGNNMDRNNGNGGRRGSSEAAPPSRGNGGHGGASRTVQTKLGPLNVSRRSDGKLGIVIPPALRPDFEEGAKVTGMSLGEYALEQVKIADEITAGGNGGLITEEGSIYR